MAYEEAMLGLVRDALEISRPNAFLNAFLPFQQRIARLGSRNSVVQTTLKLTLPGVADVYQGAELWDLTLVDPDNRRPVDYGKRIELLEDVAALLERNRRTAILDLLEDWRDLFGGRVLERRGEGVGVEAVLGEMPVAVLVPHHSRHRKV